MIEEKRNSHNNSTAFKILHKSQLTYVFAHHLHELQSVADSLSPRRPQLIKKRVKDKAQDLSPKHLSYVYEQKASQE